MAKLGVICILRVLNTFTDWPVTRSIHHFDYLASIVPGSPPSTTKAGGTHAMILAIFGENLVIQNVPTYVHDDDE